MNIIKQLQIIMRRRVLWLIALALFFVLLAIAPVWSSQSRSAEQVIIAANEVIDDDLYVAGKTVTIDGIVKGDVFAVGRQITVNGRVEGDLVAAGQAIVINGTVNDDVRIASQAIQLAPNAQITDDVVAIGFSLETKPGSTVAGGLSFAGMQALLAGTVAQNVTGVMAAFDLRGTVGSNVNVTVGGQGEEPETFYPPFLPQPPISIPQLRSGIVVADSARVGGKLTYKSQDVGEISQEAQVTGSVVREELEEVKQPHTDWERHPDKVVISQIQRLVALILVGWLLLRFVPDWTQNLATTVQVKPLPSLGWGAIACLAVVGISLAIVFITGIAVVLFALTLPNFILPAIGIGTLLNLTLFIGFIIFTSYVPQIVVSFLAGRWLLHAVQPNEPSGRLATLIVGLVAFVILTTIPLFGSILSLVIVLLGLGALWLWGQTRLNQVSDRQPILTGI